MWLFVILDIVNPACTLKPVRVRTQLATYALSRKMKRTVYRPAMLIEERCYSKMAFHVLLMTLHHIFNLFLGIEKGQKKMARSHKKRGTKTALT
jgi:hypothetical protein